MIILVINAGSSSLKFTLFETSGERVIARGLYDGLGGSTDTGRCTLHFHSGTQEKASTEPIVTHEAALDHMLALLIQDKCVTSLDAVTATAHRVVHGGEAFHDTQRVDSGTLKQLHLLEPLAPLHNPLNVACLGILMDRMPRSSHYAVFDTAFHQTMPEESFLYGLPYSLYESMGIRKYGFHGTNHRYVALRAAEMLGTPVSQLKLITCHLGNGQSICAVKHGRSVDTSMGFTPLEGLPMGTRSGSFDPQIILHLLERGYSTEAVDRLINKESGLLGVSGLSGDCREIEKAMAAGHRGAARAYRLMAHHISKTIGSYAAAMDGVDAIVFTGGIGEHAVSLRRDVLHHFSFMGCIVDDEKNAASETIITAGKSSVAALIIPANEELQIVREVAAVISSNDYNSIL